MIGRETQSEGVVVEAHYPAVVTGGPGRDHQRQQVLFARVSQAGGRRDVPVLQARIALVGPAG